MRILIALGGNALLKKGEALNAQSQRQNVRKAAEKLMPLILEGHQLIITHGSGPQIGLLSLQEFNYQPDDMFPLDVLDAEVAGMIGYVLEQELFNAADDRAQFVSVLTQIEVDRNDPAFRKPSKPIGPFFSEEDANQLAEKNKWTMVPDKGLYRRAVPSPFPLKIVETAAISSLVQQGFTVICGGGGGIPVVRSQDGNLHGVEAVIDKDHSSALIAENLDVDFLMLLTDVDGVYRNWGDDNAELIVAMSPDQIDADDYPAGSMRPKVVACANFVTKSGNRAVIGSIEDISDIMAEKSGTFFG